MGHIYAPSPVQAEFHACPANEILLGGAAGPGKSLALMMDPFQTQIAEEHERWQRGEIAFSLGWAIHLRKEYPRLQQTIERSKRLFPQIDKGARWDSNSHTWTWSCGYKTQFGHLHNEDDRARYLSNEYTHIAWDELPEIDQESYQFVNSRLRTSDPVLQKKLRIVAASNPSPGWVRDYFVEPARDGRVFIDKKIVLDDGSTAIRTRVFIPATLKDNPDANFRRLYEIELQDKPAHLRRALLHGDWYVLAGAFFAEEFTPAHVVDPFKVPRGWSRFRSLDWGYKKPGTCLWWAVDPDDNLLCYRELTFRRKDAGEVARIIAEIERVNDEWDDRERCSRLSGPADDQICAITGTVGPTIEESMAQEGVYWEKATKNRRASVQQFLKRLKDRSGHQGAAAIRFFRTCKNTLRTVPAIGTDPNDAELPEDGGEDHWLDAVLYACMYRAPRGEKNEKSVRDELEERRERRRVARRGRFGYGGF